MNIDNILGVLVTFLTWLALFVYSFFALFRTRLLMSYYLRSAKKNYLRSLKRSFFSNRLSRYLAKRSYEKMKNMIESRQHIYSIKIAGIGCLLFSIILFLVVINEIFGIKFGLFTN